MKRVIYICFTMYMLFITFALGMACLHSCKDDTPEPTITVDGTPEEVYKCVDMIVERTKPNRYAFTYQHMEGNLNLTVDFLCCINYFYSRGTNNYYTQYMCYIIDGEIVCECMYDKRV